MIMPTPKTTPYLPCIKLNALFFNLIISSDDLMFVAGKEDDLLGRIQRKTGKSRDEVVSYINSINR